MYEILCASEVGGLNYTHSSLAYFEIRDNEFWPVASRIREAGSSAENALKSAALRARNGESRLMVASGDEYGNITFFQIDDVDALLTAYGLSDKQNHRHQLYWEYSTVDNGIDLYADVELTFLCGCHLNAGNVRTREKELREQYGLQLRLSGVRTTDNPAYVRVGIRRKELRNMEHELK